MTQLEFFFVENVSPLSDGELLRSVVIDGIEIKEYSVSNLGNVYSHIKFTRKSGSSNGFEATYDRLYVKKLKPKNQSNGYLSVDISFDVGLLPDTYYSKIRSKRQTKTCRIHQLVMDAFRPFDEHLPEIIDQQDYEQTPESIKAILRQLFIVDHKNHDKADNSVTNLERVTQRENTRRALKHYDGCFKSNSV
jgi:hypothetical protein